MTCLICGAANCTCKGRAPELLSPSPEEGVTIMAETTFGNAVYLNKEGGVVDKRDPSALTKISAAEAARRGLVSMKAEYVPPADPELVVFPDGSSLRSVGNLGTPTPPTPPAPADNDEKRTEAAGDEEEDESEKRGRKAVTSDRTENKSVSGAGKK